MRQHRTRTAARLALGLAGSLLVSFAAHAVEVISGPTLTMNPNNLTPLAGVVELETDVAVEAELTITFGSEIRTVEFPAATTHYLPVLGLKPDRTYTVDIVLVPGGPIGSAFATTDPLPDDFPALVTHLSIPEQMEPGYTYLDCFGRAQSDPRQRYSAIVDSAGDVVWYVRACYNAGIQMANGSILLRQVIGDTPHVRHQDLLANFVQFPVDNPGQGLHHDLIRTPHGTYLSLDRQSVDIPEFPTSETDPDAPKAPATLWDDSVVEFLPDGTLRREWPLVDLIDLTRIGYSSLGLNPEGYDWTHSNAVNYRLADDSIIVSVRHQDAVIKFSRETGELQWILGPHDNWSPEFQQFLLHPVGSPFRWQFHQHAPMWTGDGTLVLFDNGNFRASPFDGTTPMAAEDSFSRGVEFEIDEKHMQVRQIWEYGEHIEEQIYARFICDADWQRMTGNVLMTFGGTGYVGGVSSVDLGLGQVHARIIETTDDIVPVKVFDMLAYDRAGGRLAVYRSERIPDLYPQRYIRPPLGVGDTLRGNKVAGEPRLLWMPSPVDQAHDPADHYRVYASTMVPNGFAMLDSTAYTEIDAQGPGTLVFYRIVAGNLAGTSGDEPAP